MKALPNTRDEWVALILFPFKAYVVMALPLLRILRFVFAGMPPWYGYSDAAFAVMLGYHLCVLVLLLGALAQALFSRPGSASRTLCFIALGLWFDWIAMDWTNIR